MSPIFSNEVAVTITSPYSHTWTETGIEGGDTATLSVNGVLYSFTSSATSITVSGLSGTVDWTAFDSNYGLTPSPGQGSVTGSGTTDITFSGGSPET